MKTYTITMNFPTLAEARQKIKTDKLFEYLGSINIKPFGSHAACSLMLTFIDYEVHPDGDNIETSPVTLIAKVRKIDIREISGKHVYRDFNVFLDSSKLVEDTPDEPAPNATT